MQHAKANSPLGDAMRQCGLDNFTIEVIEICETAEQARQREIFWINVLKCKMPNGYNRSNGGEGGIHKLKTPLIDKEVSIMAIGDNIKNLRLKHGLSQLELADVVGVSDKEVSTWEQNKVVPRMGAIQKMADYFGIQKSDIIEPSDAAIVHKSDSRAVKKESSLNQDESKLLADYRNLNGNNRQAVNVMIALFLSQQTGDNNLSSSLA